MVMARMGAVYMLHFLLNWGFGIQCSSLLMQVERLWETQLCDEEKKGINTHTQIKMGK